MKDYINPVVLVAVGTAAIFLGITLDGTHMWQNMIVTMAGAGASGSGWAQIRLLRKPGGPEHVRALNKV